MGSRVRDKFGLTDQQRTFADKYLSTGDIVGSYRFAYPNCSDRSVDSAASRLLRHVKVAAYISRMNDKATHKVSKRLEITKERILAEMARLAFYNIDDMVDEFNGVLPVSMMDRDDSAAVVGIDKDGTIKLADKLKALRNLAEIEGMFEKHNAQQGITVLQVPAVNKPEESGT